MSITTVLFDLDGTLLPMDQDVFIKAYFGRMAKKMAAYGYEPEKLIKGIWAGMDAMVKNDGHQTNEDAFWERFCLFTKENARDDEHIFQNFYENEFKTAQSSCGFNPLVANAITAVKNKGLRIALATNPVFPAIATLTRIGWAGLDKNDFELITTYENSSHCKPNIAYYEDIIKQLNVSPEECLMVGNDVTEDMIASKLGMKVFLLTDDLINKENKDISVYPNGGYNELISFINNL